MKKNTLLIVTFFITSIAFSQQIGDGFAPPYTPDFTVPLKSGVYGGFNAIGSNPDLSYSGQQHLFVIRHTSEVNNHQLQISSSFITNDRLFFRKIASDLTPKNPTWIELATRGTNTFTGNQIVYGNVGIGNPTPEVPLSVYGRSYFFPGKIDIGDSRSFEIGYTSNAPVFVDNNYPVFLKTGGGNQPLILDAARVGIGTSNPDAKLAVNGTIHSKEVKVDLLGWPDFVFKKEYKLPTLEEVEKHINEKGHLENIPNEDEVSKNGINLGEMNAKLLQKIEELTLYMIEMKKENVQMKSKQSELENTIKEFTNKIK